MKKKNEDIPPIKDLYSKSSFIRNVINVPKQSHPLITCFVYLQHAPIFLFYFILFFMSFIYDIRILLSNKKLKLN